MDPKPGQKTTEFWVSIGGAVLGIAVLLGFLSPDESQALSGNIQTLVGGGVSAISVVGYAFSRAKAKGSSTDVTTILNTISALSKAKKKTSTKE